MQKKEIQLARVILIPFFRWEVSSSNDVHYPTKDRFTQILKLSSSINTNLEDCWGLELVGGATTSMRRRVLQLVTGGSRNSGAWHHA